MYYNEEVKSRFIADYMRSRIVALTSLTGMFNKTSHFEKEKGKDCCEFSQAEILEMYKDFKAKSVNVLENYTVYLKAYCNFTIYKGISKENNYNGITKDMLMDCIDPEIIKQKYITREELDDIEDQLYNWQDKAILEALWNGISGKSMSDLVALHRNMISKDKKYITLKSGKKIKLTEKLYKYLDKAFNEKEYICYSESIMIKKLVGENCLYKERDNAYAPHSDDKMFRWVYRRVQIYRDYVGMPLLTMKNVQASGLLFYLKAAMEETGLELRDFLRTQEGKELAEQYGYSGKSAIDVIANKVKGVL